MLECDESSKYFAKIHACVSLADTSSPAFLRAFAGINNCAGNRVIRTKQELESLRYCDHIWDGGLTFKVNDVTADFYSMNNIDVIEGLVDGGGGGDGGGQHCFRCVGS